MLGQRVFGICQRHYCCGWCRAVAGWFFEQSEEHHEKRLCSEAVIRAIVAQSWRESSSDLGKTLTVRVGEVCWEVSFRKRDPAKVEMKRALRELNQKAKKGEALEIMRKRVTETPTDTSATTRGAGSSGSFACDSTAETLHGRTCTGANFPSRTFASRRW